MSDGANTEGKISQQKGIEGKKGTPRGVTGRLQEHITKSIIGRLVARVKGAQGRNESGITELVEEDVRPVKLTAVERHQVANAERPQPIDELTATVHERLQGNHRLSLQLLTNPYAPRAREVFEREFGQQLTPEAMRSLILAEPREVYDQNFSRLDSEGRENDLYQQIDKSADMTVRLGQFVEQQGQELFTLPDEELFQVLSQVAFNSRDMDKIGREFSQSQRRGFRLSIVNFIDGMRVLQPYGQEFIADPQTALQKYKITDKALQSASDVTVEVTPAGIVVMLNAEDYRLIGNEQSSHAKSAGRTLFYESLPSELRGRVIIINNSEQSVESIQETKRHEIQHAAFASFFARSDFKIYSFASSNDMRVSMLQNAADEVMAYAPEYGSITFFQDLRALGGDKYSSQMAGYRGRLFDVSGTLTPDEADRQYKRDEDQRILYMQQVAEYQWMVVKLMDAGRDRKNGLTEDKVIALLRNTRPDRISRLGHYLGISPTQIHGEYLQEREKSLQAFVKDIDLLVAGNADSEAWGEKISYTRFTEAVNLYPVEIIPTLLKVMTTCPNIVYLRATIKSLSDIVETQIRYLPEEVIAQAKNAFDILKQKQEGKNFADVVEEMQAFEKILSLTEPSDDSTKDSLRPDFRRAYELRDKIRSVGGDTPSYRYSLEQQSALADILTPEEMIRAHLQLVIMQNTPRALPVSAKILGKVTALNTYDADVFIGNALGLVERLSSDYMLQPDQRQALEKILSIVEMWNPPDMDEVLAPALHDLRMRTIAEIRERLH